MSMAIKYAMMKHGKKMAKGGPCEEHGTQGCEMCHGGKMAEGGEADLEKLKMAQKEKYSTGIHKPNYEGIGSSPAGSITRAAHKGTTSMSKKELHDMAKQEHHKVLHDMKHMKKPHLYADGGFIDEEEASGYHEMPSKDEEEPDVYRGYMAQGGSVEDEGPDDMVGRIMKHRMKGYSKGGRVSNETPITADFEPNQFDDLVSRDDLEHHYTGKNSGDEIGDEQEDEDRRDIVKRIMRSRHKKDRMPHPA